MRHAYVFAPANSVKYLIYYGAGGLGEATGKPIGEFQVFTAGPLVQGKDRIYGIEGFAPLPPEKMLVGRFDLKAGQPTPTTRDFYLRHTYLRMLDCSSGPNGFVSALAEDEAQKPSGFGIMGPNYPMRFKDGFNLTYTAWLQSASCINMMATVSVYKD